MRSSWLIGICCVLVGSCKDKDKVPGDVLPKEKMQAVLWDMMRADQFLTDFVFNRDTVVDQESESIKFYHQIFSIHSISKEEFQRSFDFYRAHPKLLRNIMDSIGQRSPNPILPDMTRPDTAKRKFTPPLVN